MENADGITLPLQQCDEGHDLGVLFIPNLKLFREYINKIICKANSVVDILFGQSYISYPLCQFGLPTFGICLSDLEPTFNRRYIDRPWKKFRGTLQISTRYETS